MVGRLIQNVDQPGAADPAREIPANGLKLPRLIAPLGLRNRAGLGPHPTRNIATFQRLVPQEHLKTQSSPLVFFNTISVLVPISINIQGAGFSQMDARPANVSPPTNPASSGSVSMDKPSRSSLPASLWAG